MSRPRFLADHDLNDHIVDGVLRREPIIEFVRARDAGMADRPDVEILEFAAEQDLLVVSHDVNTMPGHAYARLAAGQPMPGLLMIQQMDPVREVIDDLVLIWAASEAQEWSGQVRFLPF
jgi:predicted nuclease of predicted toxin-antitoxin system